jgi:F420-non-reducing hydrogenase iron-sulfur subunit
LRKLLGYAGIDPARLLLDWVSGSEANRFAEIVQEFTEVVRRLGPLETKAAAMPGVKSDDR